MDPSFYCFSATNYIESLDVEGCLYPRLIISWTSLKIQSEVTSESYSLPRSVALNWQQAFCVRKLLKRAYWCVLLTKTQAGYALLSLPYRDQSSAPAYGDINHGLSMVTLKEHVSAPTLYPILPQESTSAV